MPDLSTLAAHWDALYNGPLLRDATLSYILISSLRLLIAWSALLTLRALRRYLAVAVPPPYTPSNLVYWLRWWFWLRLREFPLLKFGVAVTALVLVLQIPAGEAGSRNMLTPASVLFSVAQFALLAGLTQFLNRLFRIIHLSDAQ